MCCRRKLRYPPEYFRRNFSVLLLPIPYSNFLYSSLRSSQGWLGKCVVGNTYLNSSLKKDLHLQLCLLCLFEKNKQNQICLLSWCKAFCFECNLFFICTLTTTFRRVFSIFWFTWYWSEFIRNYWNQVMLIRRPVHNSMFTVALGTVGQFHNRQRPSTITKFNNLHNNCILGD